ncbi:ABC transporter permease [Actinomadura sp. DC4]|uniref:ABC transporter permease n=1 Tax=Actinomadura sp. DC4 TaxID=3055069 RepID=UPI0025B13D39|nr:ABC transporter permease [Actinomadura sp. DC4]MDN3354649.1 ABC transporter permease [Actinomadura sp. DC4]
MSDLAGTGLLAKINFRRDRIMMPGWLYLLTAVAVGTAYSSRATYDSAAKRLEFGATVNKNPALLALYGPVQDPASIGSVSLWKVGGIAAALVAVMSILITVRHTRADEEAGRLELVSAGVVGRYAALTAGVTTALTANVVLLVLVGGGLMLLGLPVAGSIMFALFWCSIGVMFTGVAAVTAQLTTTSRAANGLALTVLAGSYLIRAVGDVGPSWLVWASPLGWTARLRPYAGERWWVLAIVVAFAAVCFVSAFRLVGRRDIGAGLLPDRLGPAEAVAGLRSPLALAWRLQRGLLLGWIAGFAIYGAAIGGVVDNTQDMLGGKGGRDFLSKLGGHSGIVDAFLTTTMGLMGLFASAYAVQAVLRLRSEETSQLVEPLLATRVGRIGWALSHIVFAVVGPAILMIVDGVLVGLIHGLRAHDLAGEFPRVFWSALVQLPAVWVLAGITVALFGLAPRIAVAAWGLLGAFLLLGQLGPLLKLKQWMMDLSPFTHVPKLPGAEMRAQPVIWMIVVAAALTALGLAAFRRRDVG